MFAFGITAATAAAVGIAIYLALQPRTETSDAVVAPISIEQKHFPEHRSYSLDSPAVADKPKIRPSQLQSHSVLEEYNRFTNGRAFIEKQWQNTSTGGRFYASKVMDECQGVRTLFPDILLLSQPNIAVVGEKNYLAASSALQFLQLRCGQITSDDYTRFSGNRAFSDTESRDLLISTLKKLAISLKTSDQRLDAVRLAMENPDPLLMQDIGKRLALYSSPTDGIFLHFDGGNFPVSGEESVSAAFLLLPCGLGLNCASRDTQLALRCISGDGCFSDRFEFVKKVVTNDDAQKYEEVLTTYRKLLEAFKTKSVHVLVPPR